MTVAVFLFIYSQGEGGLLPGVSVERRVWLLHDDFVMLVSRKLMKVYSLIREDVSDLYTCPSLRMCNSLGFSGESF